MILKLHPPQLAAINSVLLAIKAQKESGVVVLPTGVGKTIMVLSLARTLGVPTLFLVHRDPLVGQTLRAAERAWPESYAVAIEAGSTDHWDHPRLEDGRTPDLVVAMIPTLANRLRYIAPDRFGLVVVDECHHSPAAVWMRVISHFRPGFLLGVTATPSRLDGKGLSEIYGKDPLYSLSLYQAIQDGYLCPIVVKTVKTTTSLDDVDASKEGDLNSFQLSENLNTPSRNNLIVETYQAEGENRLAVCFCCDVAHARGVAKAFLDQGIPAGCVTGGTSRSDKLERIQVLDQLKRGEIRVVCNVEVLTEGFDLPVLSCVLWARPTKSRALIIQGIGRALRTAPGKIDCLVIDFVDLTKKHKLVSPLDLVGKRKNGEGKEFENEKEDDQGEKDESGKMIKPQSGPVVAIKWRIKTGCPWPESPSLDGYKPEADWQKQPASEGQIKFLRSFGLDIQNVTKGEASYLINQCKEFEAAFPAPATPKQKYYLRSHGLWQQGISKKVANQIINNHKESMKEQQWQPR